MPGRKFPSGKLLRRCERHRRRLARLRQDGDDGVGVLARDVEPAVVAELHVEGVDHRRNVLGGHHHLGEVEGVAVAAVAGDMAVLAPGVGDVEIVAHEREAAGDVQRVRIGRRVEEQRMLLARSAVVLEDADVLDAGLAFTSIADPPHDVLPPPLGALRIGSLIRSRNRPRLPWKVAILGGQPVAGAAILNGPLWSDRGLACKERLNDITFSQLLRPSRWLVPALALVLVAGVGCSSSPSPSPHPRPSSKRKRKSRNMRR